METTRVVMGLFVAVLLPRGLPYVNRSRSASLLVSGVFGAFALAPVFWTWKFPSILAVSLLWSYVLMREWPMGELALGGTPVRLVELPAKVGGIVTLPRVRDRMIIGVCAAATLLVFAGLLNASSLAYFFHHLLLDNRVAIVVTGLIAAVFVSHEPVTYISAKFMKSESKADAFGMCIGWFERAFVFAFIASGQADAAALALAAKSVARYPKMDDDHEFARYFLIGTFSSVLIAILCAVITRIALGAKPM